jgi:phosphoribosyl-ATP pyrophosphohydrolase/phosphoribosyl-AMP cyclohydrolase
MQLAFDDHGLVPAIAQDASTGVVLMLAWMNAEALERTRTTGLATFWSRSRGRLWQKGEESGNVLRVRELRTDCDRDAVLLLCDAAGPACHTGRESCFFQDETDQPRVTPLAAPVAQLVRVERVIVARQSSTAEKSYVKSLLAGGAARIASKITEEAAELAAELENPDQHRVTAEAADLIFHAMVGLCHARVSLAAVCAELGRRLGISGHAEKAARPPR